VRAAAEVDMPGLVAGGRNERNERNETSPHSAITVRIARIILVGLAACGGSHSSGFDPTDPGQIDAGLSTDGASPQTGPAVVADDASGPAPSSGAIFVGSDGSTDDANADDGCSEAAKLVYVTGPGSQLWSFYPPTLKFTLIGTMSCLDSPTHMTVDRKGSAWVVSGGGLYKASTADASCAAVPTWTPQANFPDFALTFLGTTNATDNTLYMLASSSVGAGGVLGTFDTIAGSVTTVGQVQVPSALGDMTTRADGKLYYLMDQSPPTLYELDPGSAAIIQSSAINATGGGDQALAFWGGSFYAFEDNVIYQYDTTAQTTTSRGTAPLSVTGAGQSTCVPTVPPPAK
jgi:hypothetical protein